MNNKERFTTTCEAIWGPEWHPSAAAHLGKSRRTIIHWAHGDYDPVSWESVFLSLLAAIPVAVQNMAKRKARLDDFKRAYSSGRGR